MHPHTSLTAVAYRATGQTTQVHDEDLDEMLRQVPTDVPEDDAQGCPLMWASRVSSQVAPGVQYLVLAAPLDEDRAPDPALWRPVPLREYLAVHSEHEHQMTLFAA